MRSPGGDDTILGFYKGCFDEVFISFHPFFKVLNKKNLQYFGEIWPDKTTLLNNTVPVTWREIMQIFNLSTFRELNRRLLESIHAIDIKDILEVRRFNETLQANMIVPPNEGCFNEYLFDDFIEIIKEMRYNGLILSDEWGENSVELKVSEAKKTEVPFSEAFQNAYTSDYKILFSVHWDSFSTMLCGKKGQLQDYVSRHNLEGFFCDKETKIYWL
jgi:hypothetical protein